MDTKESNKARLNAELNRRKKIHDEKDREAKERLFTELRKEREELPSRLASLEQDKEYLDRLQNVSDYLLQTIPLFDFAQRLSVVDIETTSELMLTPCLEIINDIVKEMESKHSKLIMSTFNVKYKKAKEVQDRLIELKRMKDEEDEIVPHQYSAVVNNIQTIDPTKTRRLITALRDTSGKCIEIMRASIENYNKAKLD